MSAGTIPIGDLRVNRLGFGAMRVCGPQIWGPPKDRADALKVLKRVYEIGYNFFDTADSYGPHVDEQLIAEALHPYPKDLVIATKGGLLRPRAYWALVVWVLLQILFAKLDDGSDRIAYAAHLGGFAAGAAVGVWLRFRLPEGPERDWILETPEPDQEERAVHLARAVVHNLRMGESEAMGRAWDEWDTGRAHVGLTTADLNRVEGDLQRRGDAARALRASEWRQRI